MTLLKLIANNIRHFSKANFWVALGVAISTSVLTGGLIVGDSVRHTLTQGVVYRLGNISHTVVSGERYFTTDLAKKLNSNNIGASPALKLEGIATTDGGQYKINSINVWGIDDSFFSVTGCDTFPKGTSISENLASRLDLSVGDNFSLRIKKGSMLPANAPFVSDEDQTVSTRLTVKSIINKKQLSRLSLQNSQTSPFNIFLPLRELNMLSEMEDRANVIFISTDKKTEEIETQIQEHWTLDDTGLSLISADATGEWELRSKRVFMDSVVELAIQNTDLEVTPIITYFANKFKCHSNETPYSFISTLPSNILPEGETIINEWLANDLQAKIGDSIEIFYYVMGNLRELTEVSNMFRVASIEKMNGYFSDRLLMPSIPGLSDAENCRDWQTGVPVKLESIRGKDEEYWYKYRGVPKAFISFPEAKKLWANRFGNVTAFRFKQEDISPDELKEALTLQLNPFELDLQVKNVKADGYLAAKNGTDFSSLFLGLSFFILVAGLLLTSLLFVFSIEKRLFEIGTLSALGFKKETMWKIFLIEGFIVSALGSLLGLLFAFGYNELVFMGLNKVWNEIVRTDLLLSYYKPSTFIIGWAISTIVSISTISLVLKRLFKRSISSLQRKQSEKTNVIAEKIKLITAIILIAISLFIFLMRFFKAGNSETGHFFIAGGTLLISFLLFSDLFLSSKEKNIAGTFDLKRLVVGNLRNNKSRSLMVVLILAISTFLVFSTGMNRQDIFAKSSDKKSGTGGYVFWAESTVPLLHNLNNTDFRRANSLIVPFSAVQMSVAQGDDASCLNLNRIENPSIIGVDVSELEGRFSFQTYAQGIDKNNTWAVLKEKQGECINAIADQTVIQWSLGKKVGDTLLYKNALGSEFKLKLVAGTLPSVFQGYVLIDQKYFLENFPSISGTNLFLIDGQNENKEEIADELKLNFRDLGLEISGTAERLAMFKSVENTYLAIFMALGALGLLIGTIGLAVVMQRSVLSRKNEFALLKAIGFKQKSILSIVILEYAILLFAGVFGGLICAIIAVWPVIFSSVSSVSISFVLILVAIIIANGLGWIFLIAKIQLSQLRITQELRND